VSGDDVVAAAMIDNRSTHGFQRSVLVVLPHLSRSAAA
jgi:hypothetical protein